MRLVTTSLFAASNADIFTPMRSAMPER